MRSHKAQWFAPRSAPAGRKELRPQRKIRFGRRMKPKSWPAERWFASALFNRGKASRKRAFAKLVPHLFGENHD